MAKTGWIWTFREVQDAMKSDTDWQAFSTLKSSVLNVYNVIYPDFPRCIHFVAIANREYCGVSAASFVVPFTGSKLPDFGF